MKAAEERLNQRYLNVKPLYSSLRSGQGLDYPAFSDFACFPSVTQLWMPEDALIPGTLDKTVKNAIAADVAKAKLIVKLGFACSLAKAYEEQGLTMEGGLAATLKTLPPTRIAADIKVTTEFGDTALTPYTNWWAPKQALNFEAFDDSIYDLEADVDALLRRFTSLFRCPNNCGKPLPYRQFLDHAENHRRTEGLVRYEEFKHLALVHEVLKETGLPNLVGSIATLDKSDWRFDCLNCKCSPGYWQVRNWTGAKNMTWSSFVRLPLVAVLGSLKLTELHDSRRCTTSRATTFLKIRPICASSARTSASLQQRPPRRLPEAEAPPLTYFLKAGL